MKRFKLEILNGPTREPFWFDTQEDLDAMITLLKSASVSDGPIRLRITEFKAVRVTDL